MGRKRDEGCEETSVQVDVPGLGREVTEGVWELALTCRVRGKRASRRREHEMDVETAEETKEGQQQQKQRQREEWSAEEKREREEAEYPRAPPSSPADFLLKMRAAVKKEAEQPQPAAEPRAAPASEEERGECQSPTPREAETGWDVRRLRKALDPLAAEYESFKPSSASMAAPHGDPLQRAELQQAAKQQQKK